MIVRQPLGVAGLIIAANTPIANVAWKAFPALLCGNTAVLKPAEDTPVTAWAFARLLHHAGAPAGVFNLVHGFGDEAGAPLDYGFDASELKQSVGFVARFRIPLGVLGVSYALPLDARRHDPSPFRRDEVERLQLTIGVDF